MALSLASASASASLSASFTASASSRGGASTAFSARSRSRRRFSNCVRYCFACSSRTGSSAARACDGRIAFNRWWTLLNNGKLLHAAVARGRGRHQSPTSAMKRSRMSVQPDELRAKIRAGTVAAAACSARTGSTVSDCRARAGGARRGARVRPLDRGRRKGEGAGGTRGTKNPDRPGSPPYRVPAPEDGVRAHDGGRGRRGGRPRGPRRRILRLGRVELVEMRGRGIRRHRARARPRSLKTGSTAEALRCRLRAASLRRGRIA